ncbi:ABC transporter ATP-binding protein [Paracoccus caeni]|uniref:ABC transporter ATP-binding protein n=1 Tax=Paracoccus caeni TaxID=657651 RepID=A0A934SDY6_9RHOB|nr:ABC transporter ATP-binding protein [Paracoccus caeni]MBK4215605.1 ABC transporter ATP-binding protein [Paracoccus caeni]
MADVILENIEKTYGGHTVLPNLNLTIEDGEFVVLVGPSGCGKSTTLQLVAGLDTVTSGRILIGGRDVTYAPPKDRDISMVFQSYALFPHMTVEQNIAFGPKLRGEPKGKIAQTVREIAAMLQIDGYLDRLPKALSGGQRQRVALARSLVRHPGVFLMDEPLSNLDAKLRIEARSLLARMHRDLGITTIYVTHDQSEAMTMGARIVVMKDGRIEQADPPLTVYNHPKTRFVAGFIGSPAMNFFDLVATPDGLGDDHGRVRLDRMGTARGKVTVGLRPEHIRLLDKLPGAESRNVVSMTVDVVQRLGNETLLDVVSGPFRAIVRADALAQAEPGQVRQFEFDMNAAHLFSTDDGQRIEAA